MPIGLGNGGYFMKEQKYECVQMSEFSKTQLEVLEVVSLLRVGPVSER